MKEQADNKVGMNELDSDAVANVLNYIYTGDIELSSDNAQQIIMAADFLLLEKLKVAVDDYMAEIAKDISSDYFSSYHFAVQYKCSSLEKVAWHLILSNFEAAWQNSQGSLETTFDTLHKIVSNNDLVIRDEEIVFRAVLEWVNYREERKQSFYQLFSHVRLCSLREDFLHSSVISESLVVSNPKCLKLLMEGMKNRCFPTTANIQHPRSCLDCFTNAIVVFPRKMENCKVARGPWCYIPSKDEWYQIPIPVSSPDEYGYGIAVYDGKGAMLLVRESCSKVYVNQFNLVTNSWSDLTSFYLGDNIIDFSVVCFHSGLDSAGVLYFIGGEEARKRPKVTLTGVSTLSLTQLSTSSPTSVASLKHPRQLSSVVCDEKYVYVLGGITHKHTNINGEHCSYNWCCSVERYDPHSDSWTELSPMKYKAKDDACAIAHGKIFRTVGMTLRDDSYNEVYDISSDTWSQIPMSSCYTRGGILALCDNILYLVGGDSIPPGTYNDINKHHSNTQRLYTLPFDPTDNQWSGASITHLENKECSKFYLLDLSGSTVRLPISNIETFKSLSDVRP